MSGEGVNTWMLGRLTLVSSLPNKWITNSDCEHLRPADGCAARPDPEPPIGADAGQWSVRGCSDGCHERERSVGVIRLLKVLVFWAVILVIALVVVPWALPILEDRGLLAPEQSQRVSHDVLRLRTGLVGVLESAVRWMGSFRG